MDGGTQQGEPGDLNLHHCVFMTLVLVPLLGLATHVVFDRGQHAYSNIRGVK